jgi:hypothetical protein
MITIPCLCFTIVFFFFFLSLPFFSLLHLPYLLHFLISNFPLTSQLFIYSTFGSFFSSRLPYPYIITINFSNNYLKKKNYMDKKENNLVGSHFFSISIFDFFFPHLKLNNSTKNLAPKSKKKKKKNTRKKKKFTY